jgi:hypothetical protein
MNMTRLVTVVIKKGKLRASFPFWGGILNPEASSGKGYYVRRVTAKVNPVQQLNNTRLALEK